MAFTAGGFRLKVAVGPFIRISTTRGIEIAACRTGSGRFGGRCASIIGRTVTMTKLPACRTASCGHQVGIMPGEGFRKMMIPKIAGDGAGGWLRAIPESVR